MSLLHAEPGREGGRGMGGEMTSPVRGGLQKVGWKAEPPRVVCVEGLHV